MKTSRILVLQENGGPDSEFRFSILDRTVEFEFRPPRPSSAGAPICRPSPRVASRSDSRSGLIEALSGDRPEAARFLFAATAAAGWRVGSLGDPDREG
jgi:hypothetical protein